MHEGQSSSRSLNPGPPTGTGVRNFYISGTDGICLGAWHVLPESIRNVHPLDSAIPEPIFDAALR